MINSIIASIILILTFPIFLAISIIILISDGCPIFYKQKRIGLYNSHFLLYKFRTMKKNTPELASHLLSNPDDHLIGIGRFLRTFSLDEIPQLINIVKSDMNFIGPRPALHNQNDLKKLRTKHNIHLLVPGLTGWAQINGRDEISIRDKVNLDKYYYENKSFSLDFKIIMLTIIKVIRRGGVSH